MMNEKFGKIMLQKEGGPEGLTFETFPDVQVSNTDLKWYDNNGELCKQIDQYSGRSASLQFTLSVKDKDDKDCTRLMTLLLPQTLGAISEPNMKLLQDGPRIMTEVAYESGYTQEDVENSMKTAEAAGVAAQSGVGKLAGDLNVHAAMLLFFIWDDFIDKKCPSEVKGYELLSSITSCIGRILRGKEVAYHDHDMSRSCIDVVEKHSAYFQLVRMEALRAATKWGCSPNPFLEEMERYVNSCSLEACLEWNEKRSKGSHLFHRVQKANRELTIGALAVMEAFALADGIHLRDSVRDNFVFRRFRTLVVDHIALTNDLVSFQREMANGEVGNNLILLHVEQKCSLEESLEAIQKELNSVSMAIVEAGDFLNRLYPAEEQQVARYVKLGKDMVTGVLLWCSYSKRYGPNLVFDMIVHCQE